MLKILCPTQHLFDDNNEPARNLCQNHQNMVPFLLFLQLPVLILCYTHLLHTPLVTVTPISAYVWQLQSDDERVRSKTLIGVTVTSGVCNK